VYTRKLPEKSVCDELGDESYMQAYIEEAGMTSLCSIGNPESCGEKAVAFLAKYKEASLEDINTQMLRLKGMQTTAKSLTADASSWITTRISILDQLVAQHSDL
jgi:hypothetical protein